MLRHEKTCGTFTCSCGFIYCRTGPDRTEEDARRIAKIKAEVLYGSRN
ncbi:MAG: TnsD family Tn7-like transposition protein [Kovacikia sp.]